MVLEDNFDQRPDCSAGEHHYAGLSIQRSCRSSVESTMLWILSSTARRCLAWTRKNFRDSGQRLAIPRTLVRALPTLAIFDVRTMEIF